ncbi:MAG TPA: GNAT family N-acetyltransferase [Candidatus Polarisedimenticolia bacterium]|nr:GNAT family N-acetyltransferase [Candidatus Polarisedimenticolia bacterium]
MSGYVIRPVKETDIEAIIALDALLTGASGPDRAGFWRGLMALHTAPPAVEEGRDAAEPKPSLHLCQVAVPKGGAGVAGFIIGDVQSWQFGLPRHGRIVTLGVHPDHRRRGVATQLATSLLETFARMGLPFVHCLAGPEDPLGDFFRSLGFRQPGFRILERPLP